MIININTNIHTSTTIHTIVTPLQERQMQTNL